MESWPVILSVVEVRVGRQDEPLFQQLHRAAVLSASFWNGCLTMLRLLCQPHCCQTTGVQKVGPRLSSTQTFLGTESQALEEATQLRLALDTAVCSAYWVTVFILSLDTLMSSYLGTFSYPSLCQGHFPQPPSSGHGLSVLI